MKLKLKSSSTIINEENIIIPPRNHKKIIFKVTQNIGINYNSQKQKKRPFPELQSPKYDAVMYLHPNLLQVRYPPSLSPTPHLLLISQTRFPSRSHRISASPVAAPLCIPVSLQGDTYVSYHTYFFYFRAAKFLLELIHESENLLLMLLTPSKLNLVYALEYRPFQISWPATGSVKVRQELASVGYVDSFTSLGNLKTPAGGSCSRVTL